MELKYELEGHSLERHNGSSKFKDFKQSLERRFICWQQGDLLKLLKESEFIKKGQKPSAPSKNIEVLEPHESKQT